MANKLTDERIAAGRKLREAVDRDGRSQVAIGAQIAKITMQTDAQATSSLRRWMAGYDLTDRNRRMAARVLGLPADSFGFEASSSDHDQPEPRLVAARTWLSEHPHADSEVRTVIMGLETLMPPEVDAAFFTRILDAILAARALHAASQSLPEPPTRGGNQRAGTRSPRPGTPKRRR